MAAFDHFFRCAVNINVTVGLDGETVGGILSLKFPAFPRCLASLAGDGDWCMNVLFD